MRISNKLPGDADAAGLETKLWETLLFFVSLGLCLISFPSIAYISLLYTTPNLYFGTLPLSDDIMETPSCLDCFPIAHMEIIQEGNSHHMSGKPKMLCLGDTESLFQSFENFGSWILRLSR